MFNDYDEGSITEGDMIVAELAEQGAAVDVAIAAAKRDGRCMHFSTVGPGLSRPDLTGIQRGCRDCAAVWADDDEEQAAQDYAFSFGAF